MSRWKHVFISAQEFSGVGTANRNDVWQGSDVVQTSIENDINDKAVNHYFLVEHITR